MDGVMMARLLYRCYEKPKVMLSALDTHYTALLSPAALEFFKEVLVADPKHRPTPAQVLAHPYLKEEPAAE
jgi:hypothetical protein